MSYAASGPGKTAPKLFHDFLLFDPLKGQNNVNYLTDVSPPLGEGPQIAPVASACKHDYTTKTRQSFTPPLDLRPDGGSEYKIAVICKKCRIHADIQIAFAYAVNPCPNNEFPLHHFLRVREGDSATHERIQYAWQCSGTGCHAQLRITFRLPRLADEERALLTDLGLLRSRYEAVVREDPSREGIRQATPVEALLRLRKYIRDSLNPAHDKRVFPANNKRFMEAFGVRGQDCAVLLDRLGFKYADNQWTLPSPAQLDNRMRADGSSAREVLEDIEAELLAWMAKLSAELGTVNPAAAEGWPSADREIERTLAAQGYQRHATLRRAATSSDELIYFSSLGALPDFSDSLIEFAFDQQCLVDPRQRPYYFECLQVITESRGTEQLQIKVATLASQELISRRDLAAAYRQLNIPFGQANQLSDEQVVDRFHALAADAGPVALEEARQALHKIGYARKSAVLINAAKQTIETYEDALTWLGNGVDKTTSDESLLAVASMKMADSAAAEESVQKAIHVIAKERKSDYLNNWLLTGRSEGYSMSVDEALRHLNIEQKLDELDFAVLHMLFDTARTDRPGELTDRAIATLEKAMAESGTTTSHSPDTWPVGLVSHGNTCYLNSLLQYYFSIKPLRDIILTYDKYKLDTSSQAEKSERVGQRRISVVEIKGGQRFAEDLKHLFERMIKEPGTAVKPEEELVCRAFLEPKDYALLTSSNSDEAQLNPKELEHAVTEKLSDEPAPLAASQHESDASSVTLQGEMAEKHESDASSVTLQGEIAESPAKHDSLPPTPPASPGLDASDKPAKATKAPPLPPRRFSTTKEEALSRAEANARQQQDVTEVHDGIMFRLRSGMLPEGKDASEEQVDALRSLFSIEIQETPVKGGVDQKPKALTDSSIQLDVPTEATDIYSALDAVFDLQTYAENANLETYKSIGTLPPLLQINIPRIGFDKAGHGGAYKSEACVKLEDEIYLDRYLDKIHPNVLPRRKSSWSWRKQLHALRKELKALSATSVDLDGPAAIDESAKYLNSIQDINKDLADIGAGAIDIAPDLPVALNQDAAQQNQRLAELEEKIKALSESLKGQFADMTMIKYRLAAVFFHRGGHGHGHYWIYIHDFQNDIWRSYNDERVEEFTKLEEIYEANTWNQGTPTYAVYVQGDRLDLIQPVHRAPERPPSPEPTAAPSVVIHDVQMQDDNTQTQPQRSNPALVTEKGEAEWDQERQLPQGVEW